MTETSSFFPPAGRRDGVAAAPSPSPGDAAADPPPSLSKDQRPLAIRASRRQIMAATTCGICLETVDDQGFLLRRAACDVLAPACAHAYCFACISIWSERTNTCPLCKERFNAIRHGGGSKSGIRLAAGEIVEVQERDQAANCSSDEDMAAALAAHESGTSSGEQDDGEAGRVGPHGYISDGFLVADGSGESEEEEEEEEEESEEEGEDEGLWEELYDLRRRRSAPSRRQPATTTRRGSGGGSDDVTGAPRRRSGNLDGRARAGGELRHSPMSSLFGGRGGPAAWAGRGAAERPRRRRRAGVGDVDGGMLPNELRQLQQEAARLVGDSPLRPRRRPPPPSRLSRYPQRNRSAPARSSSAAAAAGAPPHGRSSTGYVSSLTGRRVGGENDQEDEGPGQSGQRRRQHSGPSGLRCTATNDVISGGASSSRHGRAQRRLQRRQQQQSEGSDGWCATSSEESPEESSGEEEKGGEEEKSSSEEEEEEDGSSGSEAESRPWVPSARAPRRRSERRAGREEPTTTRRGRASSAAAATTATTAPPARPPRVERPRPPPAAASSSHGSPAPSATSGNANRRFGLSAAVGVSSLGAASSVSANRTAAGRTSLAAAAASSPPWLTRRRFSSASGAGEERRGLLRPPPPPPPPPPPLQRRRYSPFEEEVSASSSSRGPQPGGGGRGGGGSLASAASRLTGTTRQRGGLGSPYADSAAAPAPAPAPAGGATGATAGPVVEARREGEEEEEEIARGEEGGGSRKRTKVGTARGDDDDDDDMADDIWMESPESLSACPRRGQRCVTLRGGGVGGSGEVGGSGGRRVVRPLRLSPPSLAPNTRELEDEEEEAEFDWSAETAPLSGSDGKPEENKRSEGGRHGGKGEEDHGADDDDEEEEEEEEEEVEFDWRVESSQSSRGLRSAAAATATATNEKRGRREGSGIEQDRAADQEGEELDLAGLGARPGGRHYNDPEPLTQRRRRREQQQQQQRRLGGNKENETPSTMAKGEAAGDGRGHRRRGLTRSVPPPSPSSPAAAVGFLDQFRYTGGA